MGSGCRAASQRAAKHLTSVLWACLRSRGRAADVASEARCRTTISVELVSDQRKHGHRLCKHVWTYIIKEASSCIGK